MTVDLPPITDTLAIDTAVTSSDAPGGGLWRGAWRRLRRNPTAILGALIILVFVLVAVFAPLLAPYEPGSAQWSGDVTPTSVPGPSEGHLLGLRSG